MIPLSSSNISSALTTLLSERPLQTAQELWKAIRSGRRDYTLQAVYYELNKLQTAGVVVKSGKTYSLSLLWVQEILSFADRLADTYLGHNLNVVPPLPENTRRSTWLFRNFARADDFRLQLRLSLFEQCIDNASYCIYPHLLFPLLRGEKIKEFGATLKHSRRRVYCVIGSRTKLDLECQRQLDPSSFILSSAKSSFQFDSRRYLEVIGDYLLEVVFEPRTAQITERLFRASSGSQVISGEIVELLRSKDKIRVILSYSPARAKRLKKQFVNFFGLKRE